MHLRTAQQVNARNTYVVEYLWLLDRILEAS